jgi:hypothetical protein
MSGEVRERLRREWADKLAHERAERYAASIARGAFIINKARTASVR